MTETRIKISSVVEGQLPSFVREEFPLVSEFLSQYYLSLEYQSGATDLLQNIDQYVKVDQLTNLTELTSLSSDISFADSTIQVSSTSGFPDSYGLLLIDDEIITYTSKDGNNFYGCIRGFNGVTSYQNPTITDQLIFSESSSADHLSNAEVKNLSILFLKEFLNKVKRQITPGFDGRELYSGLNESLFIKQSIDFYSSKGTDSSFKILFNALYGQNVEVIKPRDFLIEPSNAQYRITKDLVVEILSGDPSLLEGKTLYQDSDGFFPKANGTITSASKILRGAKEYYTISLDYDYDKDINVTGTVLGTFSIHPKTNLTVQALSGSDTLEVDTTIGFPPSGELIVKLSDEVSLSIFYSDKTINQFLGCTGITSNIETNQEIAYNTFAYAYASNNNGELIKVRITGVLSDIVFPTKNKYYENGDVIQIKTLGAYLTDYKSNSWFLNIPARYDVEQIQLLDSSDFTYRIYLYDNHNFVTGDLISIVSALNQEYTFSVVTEDIVQASDSKVLSFNNRRSFIIRGQGPLNPLLFYTVIKSVSKVNSNYPGLSKYTTNVQNTYTDLKDSLYVASNSLPYYGELPLQINDGTVTFSGTFDGIQLDIGTHGFYSGDSIVYNPESAANRLDLETGIYFVKRISDQIISLSRSRQNLYSETYISVSGTVTGNKFILFEYVKSDLSLKLVGSERIIRQLSTPNNDSNIYSTNPGKTGIFVNGVEILNYKSDDLVFYGEIQEIYPRSGGSNYDISNPPILTILDSSGSGAVANCSVVGGLDRIEIVDGGFDYLENPTISVVGGNGTGAKVEAKLTEFIHSPKFNATALSVDLSNNTIAFSSYHKFRDVEKVTYDPLLQTPISGLTAGSSYYVSVQDGYTVTLHKTIDDASVGINTVSLGSYGVGTQTFLSTNKKKKIGYINIVNSGSGYSNRKIVTTSSGINTSANTIEFLNHGFSSGELVTYEATGTVIGGLSTSTYYVTKVSDDSFRLSNLASGAIGIETGSQSYYYDTKQYINFTSGGSGDHIFNYPQPSIVVQDRIGVSTLSGQNFRAVLQPIFRGKIDSVSVQNGGSNYGSSEIINSNRQPLFVLSSGSDAVCYPVIQDGKIVDVIVTNGGSGYNSIPNLIVIGSGSGAVLTPIIIGGALSEVKIISGGNGYAANTNITVESPGSGANFEAKIKSWRVNLVEKARLTDKIVEDDGFVTKSSTTIDALQYCHAYVARNLRKFSLGTRYVDGAKVFQSDLQTLEGAEVASLAHSPIIGWAYDGNPIYGPYGYTSPNGGSIRCMVSGYELSLDLDRPDVSIYPPGFFVEDYKFKNSGDLDEHNGRFCATPEYPNGIYAYFCTISANNIDSVGPFKFYRRPVFPYVIGENYKSKPIEFNFLQSSNQNEIDINKTGWFRNTASYNLVSNRSYYDYITDPNKIQKQNSLIKNATRGKIDSITIVASGDNYQPNDSLAFDNKNTSGTGAIANVSYVEGKTISNVSVANSTLYNVEFVPNGIQGYFIGFSTQPHAFLDNDVVTFNSQFDNQKIGNIKITSNELTLSAGIGTTGFTGDVTYLKVQGNLSYPNIKENDIYQIGAERIKILNIDTAASRVRVLRNLNLAAGLTTYSVGTALTEVTRKLQLTFGISTSYQFDLNSEFYFNPSEAIGLGTTSGPGIGYTLSFASPGVGNTQINIPTRSVYLPNHKLTTGTQLSYSFNGGSSIGISTNGISTSYLPNNSIVYVAKISDDLIGISTIKVGLGSTGSFVGIGSTLASQSLLYFTNVGAGNTHSFKTDYQNTLVGSVSRNLVTVSTASTHGLLTGDNVTMSVKPGITTTIVVSYNDYHRKLIANSRSFVSADVDLNNDTITISNHGYSNGQKIIHTSDAPSLGLVDEQIYYAIVLDDNNIKLSETYYDSTKQNPNAVGITTASFGTISPINPVIKVTKNNNLVFNVSNSSLSFIRNSVVYSAFELNFYTDSNFTNKFTSTGNSSSFEVVRNGQIGIDTDATVTINFNDFVPPILYYRLEPINLDFNYDVKTGIDVDNEIINNNQIRTIDSVYSGNYEINSTTSTEFTYSIPKDSENSEYTSGSGIFEYFTNSSTSFGAIKNISIKSKGSNYKKLPQISNITSDYGTGAILVPFSVGIGSVSNVDIIDIGFEYSCDLSMRPTAKLPDVLKIQSLFSFESIGVSSVGRNYTIAPSLVVFDGVTGKIVEDVDLEYELGNPFVKILKNTQGISDVSPRIIPTNNINGAGISTIRFIPSSKDVVVSLASSYSDINKFPFGIGDKVLIEGISVGIGSTAKGYNSQNYDYALFTIVNIDPNIGGIGATVSYNLTNYLNNGEIPGTFDIINSAGSIIPEKDFPIFNPVLKKNTFYQGETVTSNSASGFVQLWDESNSYLKVSTNSDFIVGETIRSQSSGNSGIIESIISFDSYYNVDATSIVKKGWQVETGFLDSSLQKIQDSDYYQYFSYSLKSQIPQDTWDTAVSDLNHSVGFKKFSDLVIETNIQSGIGITVIENDLVGISDLDSVIDLNCISDYDLVTENSINIFGRSASDEITFKSIILQDYLESVGNRVLVVDDLSPLFNSNPRSTKFGIVDTFSALTNYKKYITFTLDTFATNQRQVLIVSLLNDGDAGYLNQYGRVETDFDLGSFDFSVSGTEGQLLFYPTSSALNNYDVTTSSYDIYGALSGIGSTSLGNSVRIESSNVTIPSGTSASTTIVGIASTYRASKILVLFSAVDGSYYEVDELSVVHNDSSVELIEYGQLTSGSPLPESSAGIGSYSASIVGSNLNINITPFAGLSTDYTVNTLRVSIGNTAAVGVGTSTIFNTTISSSVVSIATSTSPSATVVSQYSGDNVCAYYVAVVQDKTNQRYQISELISITDGTNNYLTEYGNLETHSSLGIFSTDTSNGSLKFTPVANIDAQVTVYQHSLDITHNYTLPSSIPLNNASISAGGGTYTGTNIDVKKEFNLTYKQKPIFERYFLGNDSNVVNVPSNTIRIPQNFFVTGEEVSYTYTGPDSTNAIGIATTTIAGIGTTTKLPSTVYIVKLNDLDVRVAASVSEALSVPPSVLTLSSVGIGTSHIFRAKNQNSKCLISIDNMIQSPIVATSVTTTLVDSFSLISSSAKLSGITSFFGGDLVKIDNEILKITAVGYGLTNNILVRRGWMGTGIASHSSGALVRKVIGNYFINNNVINFSDPPYGRVPLLNLSSRFDEQDYVGLETSSTFAGRVFTKSGTPATSYEPYYNNYIFDDISNNFNAIDKIFALKNNNTDITGISTSNAIILINNIFQSPSRNTGSVPITGNYSLSQTAGITSITFQGAATSVTYDPNTSTIPRGKIITSVGSTNGFGYQPLVAAGGTAIVSVSGTISSIQIQNVGSGYRPAIQTNIRVGVATTSLGTPNITFVGVASVGIATTNRGSIVSVAITSSGIGYTTSNPPIVIFDSPLSYSDISLKYSSSSTIGVGTEATVDIVVGQGSSVISFEFKKTGVGYAQGEILTIDIGGTSGIPTTSSASFREFQIFVDKTYADSFSGWSIGDLEVFDPIDNLFDGDRKTFPLKINGTQTTIRAKKGSVIDVQTVILVFINDVLQVPGNGYQFTGGSIISFPEPPIAGTTCKIILYKGNSAVDIASIDILETVKVGDELVVCDDDIFYQENSRQVNQITSTDTVKTNLYYGPGLNENDLYQRPVTWCRQTQDKIIDGQEIGKDRIIYEANILPATNLIQNLGISTSYIYVESVKTFFDNSQEYSISATKQKDITIISQDAIVAASATAVVSAAGTISSIILSDGGIGYIAAPAVTVGNPVGLGSTLRASAYSSITSGIVTSIIVTSAGTGYTSTNPPVVLIESPSATYETLSNVQYEGDFGIIVGFGSTSVGLASTGIYFDLFIPKNSFLRNAQINPVGVASTGVSGIQTGYYLAISNTNLGNSTTSIRGDGSSIGIGTTCLDNVYQVISNSVFKSNVVGVGSTYINRIVVGVSTYNGFTGFALTTFYGEYSWGRITIGASRATPQTYSWYNQKGVSGISSSPLVRRINPLKYRDYNP